MRATLWAVVVMATVTPAFSQFRLYDAQRDAAAQSAKQAADKITGGDVFRKEAQNLKILADKDIATTVADARLEMQGMINGLNTWSDVVALVDGVSGEKVVRTPTDIAARKAAIAQKRTDLNAQIKTLGDAAGQDADELKPVINTLGGVDKALHFAEDHLSLQDPGVDAAIAVLDKLQALYKSYQDEFAVVNQAAQTLTDLKVAVKRALLARLKVEEDALLTEVALHERSETEFKAVDHLLKRCAVPEGVPKDEAIDATLDRLATDRPPA